MRAAICTRYGGPEVIKIQDVPTPVPKGNEVLVRVRATTVASGDRRVRAFDLPKGFKTFGRLGVGFRGPRQPILGFDVAGDVAAVGSKVTLFKPGDAVVASTAATHAEYTCVRESKVIVKKPPNLGYEDAVSFVFGGMTAVYYLRDLAHVKSGQRVLIYGASGAVGTQSVQFAKHLGAHVTAVCSTPNVRLVSSLGADETIDYTKQDFLSGSRTYDVVFDTVGKTSYRQCKAALKRGGVFLAAVGTPGQMLKTALFRRTRVRAGYAGGNKEMLLYLMTLAQERKMKPVIERRFTFEEIAEAHRLVDTGRKKGSAVVTIAA